MGPSWDGLAKKRLCEFFGVSWLDFRFIPSRDVSWALLMFEVEDELYAEARSRRAESS